MIISANALAWLVGIALFITVLAPFILLGLWLRDWKKDQLW
jgi:hypothetical protein